VEVEVGRRSRWRRWGQFMISNRGAEEQKKEHLVKSSLDLTAPQ